MRGYFMEIEPVVDGMWSMKISDKDGNLYRYFASISDNLELLLKIKGYFDRGDVSIIHIDDIICDIICLNGE